MINTENNTELLILFVVNSFLRTQIDSL